MVQADMDRVREAIREFLNFSPFEDEVPFVSQEVVRQEGYTQRLITYQGQEGDSIPAFLLLPEGDGPFPAVLVHHQHHGQRHWGKGEVCGLVGDPLQAFGPALARRGVAVLAPDSICFEDRRRDVSGTEPDERDVDQHYNEMCYRLLRGDTLMRKVLDDGARGIALLANHPLVDSSRIGVLGHSYGGSTVLFQMGLDERIRFGCSSGAVCSYEYMEAHQIGVEMSLVIPGFKTRFEKADLIKCMAPRPFLVVSADGDKYSQDADQVVAAAQPSYEVLGAGQMLEHARYGGGHALTGERFGRIVEWIVSRSN